MRASSGPIGKQGQLDDINHKFDEKLISELSKVRCCYFQLSDYFNIISFKKYINLKNDKSLESEVKKRFISCLLLFDKVIMHSSDPARFKIIYNILKDYKLLIQENYILFLFSNDIGNKKMDFKINYIKYLENRRNEYSKDKYKNNEDKASFQLIDSDKKYMDDVTTLLSSNVNIMLRKRRSGNDTFKGLLIEDLNSNVEQVIIPKDKQFSTSQIRMLNLTIYQLLTIKKDDSYIFNKDTVDKLCVNLLNILDQQSNRFSRQTIIHHLKEELKQSNVERNEIIKAIDTRISFLYAKMNIIDSSIVLYDYHPSFEKRSTYSIKHFESFFKEALGKEFKNIIWSQEKIQHFKNNDSYSDFIKTFLSTMAELVNKKSYAMQSEISGVVLKDSEYDKILKMYDLDNKYESLKKILEAV